MQNEKYVLNVPIVQTRLQGASVKKRRTKEISCSVMWIPPE